MKKAYRLLSLLLAVVMAFGLMGGALADDDSMSGQIVILHTNDVHGAIEGYAAVAALKTAFEAKGAYVLLTDAGDYSQGTTSVSLSQGATAVEMMNLAGYDVATLGNHEFDYGYEKLRENLATAEFAVVAANVTYNGTVAFEANTVFTAPDGKKIGVFGLDTPETATKANPAKIQGVSFGTQASLVTTARAQVAALEAAGCDYIVCLGHLGIDEESVGYRSVDLLASVTGIDLFIDGHSHSSFEDVAAAAGNTVAAAAANDVVPAGASVTKAAGETLLVSAGTKLETVGVVVIAADGTMTARSVALAELAVTPTADVAARAEAIVAQIDAEYDIVFAQSEVRLNGDRAPGNRTEETNLGDLITDAFMWKATQEGMSVDAAVTNGGGIRATIDAGDITRKDVNTVLPFGNTLAVVQVTGAELLEALEASTYSTPTAIGGFPQTAGIVFTIDTTKEFDAGENYPGTTYAKPASINRVSITSVGGRAFSPTANYTIITNDFMAAGGDTYYAFVNAAVNRDLGLFMDEVVMEYITEELNGVVTAADYGEGDGEMTIRYGIYDIFGDVERGAWYEQYVAYCYENKLISGVSATSFAPMTNMNRATFVTMLYNLAGQPEVETATAFTDVPADAWYAKAVAWAVQEGITSGMSATSFAPLIEMTREQMAAFIYNYAGAPEVTGELSYADAASISAWAVNAVNYCTAQRIMAGTGENAFSPAGTANRAMGAVVLANLHAA